MEKYIKQQNLLATQVLTLVTWGGGGIRPPFRFFALFSKNLPYNIW